MYECRRWSKRWGVVSTPRKFLSETWGNLESLGHAGSCWVVQQGYVHVQVSTCDGLLSTCSQLLIGNY